MSKESVLKSIFEALSENMKDSDTQIVLLAVEFDKNGYPTAQSCKVMASPSASIAGLHIIQHMIDEQMDGIMSGLDKVANLSSKVDELIQKMGFSGIDDPQFMDYLNTSSEGQNIKELLKKLKDQFGK
jgi:hypothetical protein